jgi:hypothetical protein
MCHTVSFFLALVDHASGGHGTLDTRHTAAISAEEDSGTKGRRLNGFDFPPGCKQPGPLMKYIIDPPDCFQPASYERSTMSEKMRRSHVKRSQLSTLTDHSGNTSFFGAVVEIGPQNHLAPAPVNH